jgi:hypothetical protein
VIDPAKVLRASCLGAGLLVTTEAKIAEKPKPKTSPSLPVVVWKADNKPGVLQQQRMIAS